MYSGILQGHEVWLEPVKSYYHKGENATIKIGYGHRMKPDGLCDKEKCNVYLITPSGKRLRLPILENDGNYHIFSFKLEEKGVYCVAMEYNYGIGTKLKDGSFKRAPKREYENVEYSTYFYQYAKTYIFVGNPEKTFLRNIGHELEIIPLNLSRSLQLKATYEENLLCGVQIDCVYKGYEGKDYLKAGVTDDNGVASVFLDRGGVWMFRLQKVDERKRIDDLYDRTNVRATLTIPVEEHSVLAI